MGINLLDFIFKTRNNITKSDKLYRLTCDTRGSDRGYGSKIGDKRNCQSCRSKSTFKKRSLKIEMRQDSKDGRRKYRTFCPICKKDRGFKRARDFNRKCTECNGKTSDSYFNKNKKCKECPAILGYANVSGYCSAHRHISKEQKTKERLRTDLNYKIRKYLRSRLYNALKNHSKTGSAVSDLGCSIDEFKRHVETKFKADMSWDNYGKWHLDHIRPLSLFNLSNREDLLKACHYTNLQPLWAKDNLVKSDKYEEKICLNGSRD